MEKAKVREIRESINEALEAVGVKHGMSLTIGTMSYDETKITTKLSITSTEGASEAGVSAKYAEYVANFHKNKHLLTNLKEEHLGKKFMLLGRGIAVTFVGMTPRAGKYRCVAVTSTGDVYKCNEHNVIHGMNNCKLNDPIVTIEGV